MVDSGIYTVGRLPSGLTPKSDAEAPLWEEEDLDPTIAAVAAAAEPEFAPEKLPFDIRLGLGIAAAASPLESVPDVPVPGKEPGPTIAAAAAAGEPKLDAGDSLPEPGFDPPIWVATAAPPPGLNPEISLPEVEPGPAVVAPPPPMTPTVAMAGASAGVAVTPLP